VNRQGAASSTPSTKVTLGKRIGLGSQSARWRIWRLNLSQPTSGVLMPPNIHQARHRPGGIHHQFNLIGLLKQPPSPNEKIARCGYQGRWASATTAGRWGTPPSPGGTRICGAKESQSSERAKRIGAFVLRWLLFRWMDCVQLDRRVSDGWRQDNAACLNARNTSGDKMRAPAGCIKSPSSSQAF